MNKSLQILFGLLLILVLAYVAFLDVSTKIKDDILTKTKVMFSENNVRGVSVNSQGEGLTISRSLTLTGTAISELERERIVTLTKGIEGVCSIDNQIKLHPVVPNVPTVIKVPVVAKSISKEVAVIKDMEKKSIVETVVEKKEISAIQTTTKVPTVPTPVKAISAPSVPNVIKIEKIKLEGVK